MSFSPLYLSLLMLFILVLVGWLAMRKVWGKRVSCLRDRYLLWVKEVLLLVKCYIMLRLLLALRWRRMMSSLEVPLVLIKIQGSSGYWCYEILSLGPWSYPLDWETYWRGSGTWTVKDCPLPADYLVVPVKTTIHLLFVKESGISHWSAPDLGVSVDTSPGCMSRVTLVIREEGVYTGSRRVEDKHGSRSSSVVVEAVSMAQFMERVKGQ